MFTIHIRVNFKMQKHWLFLAMDVNLTGLCLTGSSLPSIAYSTTSNPVNPAGPQSQTQTDNQSSVALMTSEYL